jgi:exocyst complex protein 7
MKHEGCGKMLSSGVRTLEHRVVELERQGRRLRRGRGTGDQIGAEHWGYRWVRDCRRINEASTLRSKTMALGPNRTDMPQAETLLITTLFPSHPSPSLLPQSLSQPLSLLSTAFNPTISTIKRSVSTHAFLAIELYASLQTISARWEATLTKCLSMTRTPPTGSEVRDMLTALSGTVTTIRGLAMRSFPEFLVDIRTASGGNGNGNGNGNGDRGPSAGISDTTHSTLTYLETLPAFEVTVESLLQSSQSQRSWLMGASEAPSPVRSAAEEGGVVKLFVGEWGRS